MSLIEVHSKFVGYAIFLEGVSEYSVIATFPDPFQEDFRQLWDAPTLLHLLAFLVYHKYTSASGFDTTHGKIQSSGRDGKIFIAKGVKLQAGEA